MEYLPSDLFDLALALLHALDVSLPVGSREGGGTFLPKRLGVAFHLRACVELKKKSMEHI